MPDPAPVAASARQHRRLRIERVIRSIMESRWHPVTRALMKVTLLDALKEREKIRRAGWMN